MLFNNSVVQLINECLSLINIQHECLPFGGHSDLGVCLFGEHLKSSVFYFFEFSNET